LFCPFGRNIYNEVEGKGRGKRFLSFST